MAPALNPEQMALTQPWKDYVSRGLITELSAVFTPMGTMITIKVAESLPIPEGMSREAMAPGAAKAAIEASGLIPKKGKGQGNKTKEDPLPKKSLCKKDFEGDSKHMQSRLTEVIKNLGGATIAGRIGSLKLFVEGATNISDWWKGTDPVNRVRVLCDQKNFDLLDPADVAKLGKVIGDSKQLFRADFTVPSPSQEEEKEEPAPNKKGKEPKPPKQKESKGKSLKKGAGSST